MTPLPDDSFLLNVRVSALDHPASLFGPEVDPLLEGVNVQLSIIAASPGTFEPDAQPAPSALVGHPANQIITSPYAALDCAADSALLYADKTLTCTVAIERDALGQPYLRPIDVQSYVGSLPSLQERNCLLCASTQPWSYAGAVFLALLLLMIGAAGIATLTYLRRIPLPPNRPPIHSPVFLSSLGLACLALVFLIGGAIGFRAGYQPLIPGQVIVGITPGSTGAANAVPPTPTFTATPTPTFTPIPTATSLVPPSPSVSPLKTATP
jgi:hypothetical protein